LQSSLADRQWDAVRRNVLTKTRFVATLGRDKSGRKK